ncbi:dUTP diphosphatase [Pseudomonas sp. MF6776]|uniref:dUTP diphosphatase n=1 Tax=Pseudomonas sp. MF6776 TaxID=2797534 RepID=UPI00190A157B|nr:dUTP diphosphatase [Pseudomonas sp. MF6776]MBK3467742.1 dUTP diphosphatase [Pseudomonas sp. MF6776]
MERLALLQNQAQLMLRLQDSINTKINDDWRSAKNPWYRAIWTECAELMDHVGWKWWKAQDIDFPQMKLELVDIWHFGLSEALTSNRFSPDAAKVLSTALYEIDTPLNEQPSPTKILSAIESFAAATLQSKSFDIDSFIILARLSSLTAEELFKSYVGKNVLNAFRQDNGYKTGNYIKIWKNREDNVWLSEIIDELSIDSVTFAEDLYARLETAYKART